MSPVSEEGWGFATGPWRPWELSVCLLPSDLGGCSPPLLAPSKAKCGILCKVLRVAVGLRHKDGEKGGIPNPR